MSADWNRPQRDEAMAGRILAAPGTLVVAGNAQSINMRHELHGWGFRQGQVRTASAPLLAVGLWARGNRGYGRPWGTGRRP
jgi:hypothetical protein